MADSETELRYCKDQKMLQCKLMQSRLTITTGQIKQRHHSHFLTWCQEYAHRMASIHFLVSSPFKCAAPWSVRRLLSSWKYSDWLQWRWRRLESGGGINYDDGCLLHESERELNRKYQQGERSVTLSTHLLALAVAVVQPVQCFKCEL